MKALLTLLSTSLFICSSCNIEAPLNKVLVEANNKSASYVHFDSTVDTISLPSFFRTLTSVDTVFSERLYINSMSLNKSCFVAEVKDSSRMLHDVTITKGEKSITLIVVYDTVKNRLVNDTSFIISKGYLNSRLLFGFPKRPKEFYALWQNVLLPEGFITFSSHSFSILIPKEARKVKLSYIRIFGVNGMDATLDLRVSLIYGIPVNASEWSE